MQCSLDWGSEASSYERAKRLQFPQKFEIPGCVSSNQLLQRHSDSRSWKVLRQFLAVHTTCTLVGALLIVMCYDMRLSHFSLFILNK